MRALLIGLLACGIAAGASKVEDTLRAQLASSQAALEQAGKDKAALNAALAKLNAGKDRQAEAVDAASRDAKTGRADASDEAKEYADRAHKDSQKVAEVTQKSATSWWSIVAAVGTAAVPVFGIIGAVVGWYVKVIINQANAAQLVLINGSYVRAMKSTLSGAEIERVLAELKSGLEKLRDDIVEVHEYAHKSIHAMNGYLTAMGLKKGVADLPKEGKL
jgi:hypothetical protein